MVMGGALVGGAWEETKLLRLLLLSRNWLCVYVRWKVERVYMCVCVCGGGGVLGEGLGVCVGGGGGGRGLRNERDKWQHCMTLYYKYPYVSLVPRTFLPAH